MRFVLACLLSVALAVPALAFDISNMSDSDRQQFRDEIRSYLLDNPEIIMEAVRVLEERQQQAQTQADFDLVASHANAIFDDGYSWVGGNPDGDITLVEFLDYRCGYCRRAHDEVAKLLESDGNIRLIVKEFPILGDESIMASRFAVATKQVAGHDAYKNVADALMTFNGSMNTRSFRRLASGLGLDADAILERMGSDEVLQEISSTRRLAQSLNITGTPTFVLQDEMLRGYLPYDQMKAIIAEKRG